LQPDKIKEATQRRRMETGNWKLENGKWKMENRN
jgi:hypothetical protein